MAAATDRSGAERQPPAMAQCKAREAFPQADAKEEKETTPLAALPAATASMDMERVVRARRKAEYIESVQRILQRVPPAPLPWWRWLPFLRPDRNSIPVGQPLNDEEIEMLRKSRRPGYFKRLAMDRQVATDCLNHYNTMHPDDEYEPAPGEVTKNYHYDKFVCWIHGNFVARRKRSGYFSFVPAPRTLFFFEITYRTGSCRCFFSRISCTCTPLVDEPVTEAYSILGIPLWWSKLRSGKLDTICSTCSHRFYLPHPSTRKISPCEHNNARKVCEMCYHHSIVLHPDPEVFRFGRPLSTPPQLSSATIKN